MSKGVKSIALGISLLRLEGFDITEPASKKAFAGPQRRIHSMAALHEQLYRSRTGSCPFRRKTSAVSELGDSWESDPVAEGQRTLKSP